MSPLYIFFKKSPDEVLTDRDPRSIFNMKNINKLQNKHLCGTFLAWMKNCRLNDPKCHQYLKIR